jgi:hypothetical protein
MAAAAQLTPGALDPTCCPRLKPDGTQCRNKAGHRTSHPGAGWCWKHAGNTAAGQKHGAKLAAIRAMAEGTGEVDVNPLDAMLYTVRRASHLAAYYRLQREAIELDGGNASILAQLEREALGDLNQWADRAIKAGVAERMVRIAEGTGERLASALEEALEGVELSGDQRRGIVQRFAGSLSRLEREQPAIPAKASDA